MTAESKSKRSMRGAGRSPACPAVLIVDDDESWRDFACRVLGDAYEVLTAENSREGLKKAERARPRLIILDVMMPGGEDGFSLFCDLRNGEKTRDIPVIFMSEVNSIADLGFSPEILDQFLGSAPADFLEKPVKAERLRQAVDSLLGTVAPAERP